MIEKPLTTDLPHPMQPIGWDGEGVIRFKKNAIVRYLLERCRNVGFDLNDIAYMVETGDFSSEDQVQLMQLIGYSVSGFGDLGYVPEKIADQVDAIAESLAQSASGG